MRFPGKVMQRKAKAAHHNGRRSVARSIRQQTLLESGSAAPEGARPAEGLAQVVARELAVVRRRLQFRALEDEDPAAAAVDRAPAEADQASAELTREVDLRARELLFRRLRDLEQAAARIAKGTYGCCEGCGQPIPVARLRVFPQAALCVACQGAREAARAA